MHYVSSKKKENDSAIFAYTIAPSLVGLFVVCVIAVKIVPYYKGKWLLILQICIGVNKKTKMNKVKQQEKRQWLKWTPSSRFMWVLYCRRPEGRLHVLPLSLEVIIHRA